MTTPRQPAGNTPLTPERHRQIIQLLRTHNDHLPTPTRHDHAPSGFVHHTTARITCPDCLTNGTTSYHCETCHGRGYTEEPRHRDPYAIDKVQPYGITHDHHERRREREHQIATLEQQTAPAPQTEQDLVAQANQHPYAWERERTTMYRRYDHAALDQALEQLRQKSPGHYRLVHQAHIYGWLTELTPSAQQHLEHAIDYLHQRLPANLRAPAEHKHPALQRRDKATKNT